MTELHAVEERVYENVAYAINITDGNVLDGPVFILSIMTKHCIASTHSTFKLTNPVLDANALERCFDPREWPKLSVLRRLRELSHTEGGGVNA